MSFYYYLYRIISYILLPIAAPAMLYRIVKKKEDANRVLEKFSIYKITKPTGRVFWFHAASVGETNSILPLIRLMQQNFKDVLFIITTVTLSSSKIVAASKIPNTQHVFLPLDNPIFIKRFLKYFSPEIGVFVDSELWPNLLNYSAKFCKLLLINARVSDKSFQIWKKLGNFAQFILQKFSLILTTSHYEMDKINKLSHHSNLKFVGNLKYQQMGNTLVDKNKLAALKQQIGKRKILLAASTHNGEEEFIIDTHKDLLKTYPNLLTIIVPRHPIRGKDVAEKCTMQNLKIALRSNNDKINDKTSIYIADTLGELNLFFSISDATFIGGSFVPIGGHNILEPAAFSNTIIIGNYYSNFKDLVEEFAQKNAIAIAQNPAELTVIVKQIFSDENYNKTLGTNAKVIIEKNQNTLNNIYQEIFDTIQ